MPFRVEVKFKSGQTGLYENITEIHYNYSSVMSKTRIAFESSIDGCGYTYNFDDIEEFEAKEMN